MLHQITDVVVYLLFFIVCKLAYSAMGGSLLALLWFTFFVDVVRSFGVWVCGSAPVDVRVGHQNNV